MLCDRDEFFIDDDTISSVRHMPAREHDSEQDCARLTTGARAVERPLAHGTAIGHRR